MKRVKWMRLLGEVSKVGKLAGEVYRRRSASHIH